jgi:hypothetical protein
LHVALEKLDSKEVRMRSGAPLIKWFVLPLVLACAIQSANGLTQDMTQESLYSHLRTSLSVSAVASATGDDIRIGSTSTKVSDFVNRDAELDDLYVFPPLLEACCRVIGRPFKLSSLLARTLRPCSPAQELHVDVRRDSADWPLLGFILMVDEFRPDNGATRLVPGSRSDRRLSPRCSAYCSAVAPSTPAAPSLRVRE